VHNQIHEFDLIVFIPFNPAVDMHVQLHPYEMTFRAQGNDATAVGTKIAIYRQRFDKPIKVAGYTAVTPSFPVFAAQAARRIRPRITTAFFMNLLEINGNKPYHQNLFVKGAVTPKKWAESWPKLSGLFLLPHKKRHSPKVQRIR
jgi:hypothetical protein